LLAGISQGGTKMKKLFLLLLFIPILLFGQWGHDVENPADAISVGSVGCDFTTIQAAIDACLGEGAQTILVYPGTYTETITFDVDSVSIIGMGRPVNTILTQADANIVDFGAYSGNSISNIAIRLTAPTDASKDAVTISTGSASLRFCNLYLATASTIAGADQPYIAQVTGAGTLKVQRGQAIYRHTGNTTNGIKTIFNCAEGGTLELYKVYDIDIDNSGTATATAIFSHATTGTILINGCRVDVDDDDATYTVGFGYLAGTATDIEFNNNVIHVHGADNNVYSVYVIDADVRSDHNHIHVETSGSGGEYSFYEAGTGSIASHFDDIIAPSFHSGNVTMVSSEADGNLILSGGISANDGNPAAVLQVDAAGLVSINTGTADADGEFNIVQTNDGNELSVDTYDDGGTFTQFRLRKSKSDAIGTRGTTTNNDYLGAFRWYGVDTGTNWDLGAEIIAQQDGTAGVNIPTNLLFSTSTSTGQNTNQLVLHNDRL